MKKKDHQDKVIVVLGMHRSGTSALTRGLHVLGASLGENLLPPVAGNNAKVFFEDAEINAFNIMLLKIIGSDWLCLSSLTDQQCVNLNDQGLFRQAVELLRIKISSKDLFAFKDQRVSKLLPFWDQVFKHLNLDVYYLIVIRNPFSVAKSLAASDGLTATHSYLLWLGHMLEALRGNSGKSTLFVDYDLLMQSPERQLQRIANILKLELNSKELKDYTDCFVDSEPRHTFHRQEDLCLDEECPVLVQEVFNCLTEVASDKVKLDDDHFKERLLTWLNEFDRLKTTFNLIDAQFKKVTAFKRELQEQGVKVASLQDLVADHQRQASLLYQNNQALIQSSSWRFTKPLRGIRISISTCKNSIRLACNLVLERFARNKIRKIKSIFQINAHELPNDFDANFYLKIYPDVESTGLDPAEHYLQNGRSEGRLAKAPSPVLRGSIEAELDPDRQTVLVVSHEASRSGAPILSLNLVRSLKQRYNVVALLLGGGPLINDFQDEGAVVVELFDIRHNPLIGDSALDQLFNKYVFKFALVNSIESRAVLPALARHFIPSLSLLHEFAAYTRPRDAFYMSFFWSGAAVFSAKLTRQNALEQYPELSQRFKHILPQGRCFLPLEKIDETARGDQRNKLMKVLRPNFSDEQPFLVIGAGSVQFRKGVDLFLDCAARVIHSFPIKSVRFVWVGKGYDPDNDTGYSVYLADQIERAGLAQHVAFLGETPDMAVVYEAADLMLLTSRLDPLPNVAIDALTEGLPVLCFEKTTGIADILVEGGLQEDCVAQYLDTQALAEKILRLATDPELHHDVAVRCKHLASSTFDMVGYVQAFERLAEVIAEQTEQEARDVSTILSSKMLDMEFSCSPSNSHQPIEEIVRAYVRSWAAGIGQRKPFSGFHPGMYLEQHEVCAEGVDPLADYLRSNKPDGPWLLPVIRNTDEFTVGIVKARVALHLHVFYPELLPEILERLDRNATHPDLFISAPTSHCIEDITRQLACYPGKIMSIEAVPNRGRDIGPFLTAFGPQIAADYDFIGHLHTKKSVHIQDASVSSLWYRFLLENLLGGESGSMMDRILRFMRDTPHIGLVFPDDPNVIGWGINLPSATTIAESLGIKELPKHIIFPVGNMFWARVDALKPFWDLGLTWDDYPEEPIPIDGTMLHALERLLPLSLADGLNKCALTNVAGISR